MDPGEWDAIWWYRCDAPKLGGPLTTHQPVEDLWMSGNPTPHHRVLFSETYGLMKIGQSLLCTGTLPKIQPVQKTWQHGLI